MPEVLWYYAKNDQQLGPVTPTELKKLAESRALLPDDLIWREGMESWVAASRVRGLFPPGELREPAIAPPVISNGPTETMPPTEVAAILAGAGSATPEPAGIPAEVFLSPSPATAIVEPPSASPPPEASAITHRTGFDTLDFLWLAQVLLWGICIATVFIGGVMFTVSLVGVESSADEAAAAVTFATFIGSAYILARAGERVAYLVQIYFERRRGR